MNIFTKSLFKAVSLVALIAMPIAANTVQIPVSPIPSTGSANGLTWNITSSGNTWTYLYTITASANNGSLIIGAFSSVGLTNANLSSYVTMLAGSTSGAGQFDTHLFGVSFNPVAINGGLSPQIQFVSNIAPIWGSDAINTTSPSLHFQNANYGVDTLAGTSNFTGWVPVIGNITTAVPEPGTWLLLGSCLLAVVFFKRNTIKNLNSIKALK